MSRTAQFGTKSCHWPTMLAATIAWSVVITAAQGAPTPARAAHAATLLPTCGDPNSGDCFVANGTPFCDDEECCLVICSFNPFCCDVAWDGMCAGGAVAQCGADPIANDLCENRTAISDGFVRFSTIGSTSDGPPLPVTCDEGFGLSFVNDIWYLYESTCNGLITVSTCNSADYDTRLAAYVGDCGDLTLVACNDDGPNCAQSTSLMTWPGECGVAYTIRVGGFGGSGVGFLSVSCDGAPCDGKVDPCGPCEADLDGSGVVDGADLGLLLLNWGACTECCADLSGGGVVDGADLGLLLLNWGPCEPPSMCIDGITPDFGGPFTPVTIHGCFPEPDWVHYCAVAIDSNQIVVPFNVHSASPSQLGAVVDLYDPDATTGTVMYALGVGHIGDGFELDGATVGGGIWSWSATGPGIGGETTFTPAPGGVAAGETFHGKLVGGQLRVIVEGACSAGDRFRLLPRAHHDGPPHFGYDCEIPCVRINQDFDEFTCAAYLCAAVKQAYLNHPHAIDVDCIVSHAPSGGVMLTLTLPNLPINWGCFNIQKLEPGDCN